VRRRQHGELEFLGRNDHQVKVRGFRIELGEIEAVIRAHPQVADSVAVAAPDASGERAVRAYVVPRALADRPALLVESVRAAVRQALPAHMCPASFVLLAALPRTPNGKVDRAALPLAPASAHAAGHGRAGNPMEQRLAAIWSTVLEVPEVGVDANFFEIGGHSLLAVRLLVRIEAEFGRKLSLAALFQHPTIAGQARLLEQGDTRAFDFRQVVTLQSGGTRPPLIAINNTGIYYALSKHLGPEQPFTSLQLFDPSLPRAQLPRTLSEIATGYAQLIRRVQPSGPYALLGWCVAGTLAFEVARQLRVSGQKVSRLILFDTLAPGRLQRLPWLTAVLADYSYRWKLIAADWHRAHRGARPLATFLGNRTIVRKFLRHFARRTPGPEPAQQAHDLALSPEQYDQWLLQYLEAAAASYQPLAYPGTVTLFRSSQEPAGRFLDPQMGWGDFAEGGIEVVVIEGDHFSIFQEPSVSQMAQRIDSAWRLQ
jgi:thioesterase domain-containing protein/acyl carrier protein